VVGGQAIRLIRREPDESIKRNVPTWAPFLEVLSGFAAESSFGSRLKPGTAGLRSGRFLRCRTLGS
jgi:hypothetical protein